MFYSEFKEITTTFSGIKLGNLGEERIHVFFEKPIESGFASAEVILPDYIWVKQINFTEDELFYLEKYARNNAPLIWEIAKEEESNAHDN